MSDLFEQKSIAPMLIGASGEAFDSPDYIYELKLDGVDVYKRQGQIFVYAIGSPAFWKGDSGLDF